jgi:hypothetical protein
MLGFSAATTLATPQQLQSNPGRIKNVAISFIDFQLCNSNAEQDSLIIN